MNQIQMRRKCRSYFTVPMALFQFFAAMLLLFAGMAGQFNLTVKDNVTGASLPIFATTNGSSPQYITNYVMVGTTNQLQFTINPSSSITVSNWDFGGASQPPSPLNGNSESVAVTPFAHASGSPSITPVKISLQHADGTCTNTQTAVMMVPVQVTSVSFGGTKYWQLESDDGATNYSAPQWTDTNGNYNASDPGEHNYAVAYTRNTKPKIGAMFKIPGASNWTSLSFKATGSDGISIPATAGTVGGDGTTVTMPLTESTTTLPNTIKYYNKADSTAFTLNWSMSVNGSTTWSTINSTKHTVYVTLGDSQSSDNQETIFYLGCKNQGTQTDSTAVAETIFNQFKSLSLCPVGSTSAMTYWGTWASSSASQSASPNCFSTAGLLKMGDGRCGAWANFLVDLFEAQGIAAQNEDVTTTNITGLTGAGFLVKNWDLSNLSSPVDLPGVPGQNNSNPEAAFVDHALVSCSGILYDPSYGKEYSGGMMRANLTAWEDASLAAALYQDTSNNTHVVAHTAGTAQTQMNP